MATITLSGNEITDTIRTTATSGDGLPPEGSVGIWEASTNLAKNGGFETDTQYTRMRGAGTRTRVTTDSKFGSACCFVEPTAGSTFRGVIWQDSASGTTKMPASSATIYTFSAWVKAQSPATQLRIAADCYDGTPTYLGGLTGSVGGSWTIEPEQGWVRIYVTGTTPVGTTQFDPEVSLATTDGKKFWVDGYQVEQQPLATPYIETNGSTATRNLSRVQVPSSVLDETQGWVALRVRYDWPHTGEPHQFPGLFRWADDTNNRIEFYHELTGNLVYLDRKIASVGAARSTAVSWSAGASKTFIAAWTGSAISISVDGGAFVSTSQTSVPTLSASLFDVGNGHSSGAIGDFNLFWFACGLGTVSNAQAAAIHGIGNADAPAWQWPPSMQTTLVWDAQGSGVTATAYGPDDKPQWAIYPPLGGILYPPISGVV